MEGSDETLLESVRSATALANRGGNYKALKQIAPVTSSNVTVQPPPLDEAEEESIVESDSVENESTSKTKKARVYPSPQVIDIDLKSGSISFENFAKQKNPEETTKKYLVCAAWLRENLKITNFTVDHIYTCFRHMGWSVQKDVGQPLRSGTRAKHGYYRKGDRGQYEITHIGLDVVNKMNRAD